MSLAATPTPSSSPARSFRFETVAKHLLLPNPWNPNKMTADMYAKALESIQQYGFIDPLLVRDHDGLFQIIDGEHRFRAGVDLGLDSFPCTIVAVDDATAKKLTIVMNELHGQADPHKMGDLLAELLEGTTIDQLLVALPYDEGTLAGFLSTPLPDLPPLGPSPSVPEEAGTKTVWVERLYRMPREVALVVDEAIEKARDGEEIEPWQGLERVVADYLAS